MLTGQVEPRRCPRDQLSELICTPEFSDAAYRRPEIGFQKAHNPSFIMDARTPTRKERHEDPARRTAAVTVSFTAWMWRVQETMTLAADLTRFPLSSCRGPLTAHEANIKRTHLCILKILPSYRTFDLEPRNTKTEVVMEIVGKFEPLLGVPEAAKLLGVHGKTIQAMARAGTIPCTRLGKYWRFRASALDAWVAKGLSSTQPVTAREES